MFEYEVALSFAGEQRSDVSDVAECLKKAGVNVFYDEYEKVDFWGKNLFDHLSDVYQNKAKYCVIFISKEYVDKAWTTLERQNAQARALNNKGVEYILPVRFDSTDVPGLPSTIAYLDFKREGPGGICFALLAKLGKDSSASRVHNEASNSCALSPRAIVRSQDGKLAVPNVESCAWGDKIEIKVRGSEDDSFFSRLRQERPTVVVAYGFDVAVAKVTAATRHAADSRVTWNLAFDPLETDFNTFMEVASGGVSADEFARMRVERLLLDKHVYRESDSGPLLRQVNDATHEVMIRGMNQTLKIENSPFPGLFNLLGSNRQQFIDTAWIVAVANLKQSASIEVIDRLVLTLTGATLAVDFAGRRRRRYVNVDPYEISVQGVLKLALTSG